jgi:hypothetical protein
VLILKQQREKKKYKDAGGVMNDEEKTMQRFEKISQVDSLPVCSLHVLAHKLGLDAELSKKEELISALGEYFPMSPELVAHAEKAKELDGLTVNQLKAVLRHLELEHGGVRPVLWERLMPHLPLTDAAKTVAQKAKQIDAAAAAAKLAAQKAKQTAAPSTTTTDEPATESADVANGGVAAMEEQALTNIAMPTVEINIAVRRVRGDHGRVGGLQEQVPTTLLAAIQLLVGTKTNCGAQIKRNVEYVMQLVPDHMKEGLIGVVATAPWKSNSAGPLKKVVIDALKAAGLVPTI